MNFKSMLKNFLIFCYFTLSFTSNLFAEESKDFSIGIVIPLTGDLAEYGVAIQNGFELAKADYPEKFKHIKYIYEDSRYEGKTAVTALQKLRTQNNVDLYYLWGVAPTEALLPIAEANKLPVIAETTVKDATANKNFVVRAAITGEMIAKILSDEIVRRKIKNVSVIVADITYYNDILRYLKIFLAENNVNLNRVENILPSETDFKSIIPKLQLNNTEIIGTFLLPSQYVPFYKQAKLLHSSLPSFSAGIIDSKNIIDECPDNIEGAFFNQVALKQDFRERYKNKFNNDTYIGIAAQTYDTAVIIANLFGSVANRLTNTEIIKIISSSPPYEGVTGTIKYTETKDGGKELKMSISLHEIKDKKVHLVNSDGSLSQ